MIAMILYQNNVFDLCQSCNIQLVPVLYPGSEIICDSCKKEIEKYDSYLEDEDILIPKKCSLCGQKKKNLKIRPKNKNNVLSQKIAVCDSCLDTYY